MKLIAYLIAYMLVLAQSKDLPCIPKTFKENSFVCVCNSTYCDTVQRIEDPGPGNYIMYSSDKKSKRFQSTSGILYSTDLRRQSRNNIIGNNFESIGIADMAVNTDVNYQNIIGFGGAVTDATCINFMKLGDATKEHIIRSYFSKDGLEYNMARVPIAGTDFSTHPYAYNESPNDDKYLSSFSLTSEDKDLKIPFLKQAMNQSTDDILIVSAAWSPPLWMKTNEGYGGYSMLLSEYYHTWALYHVKFIEEYKKEGIDIWAISTGNEPTTGLVPINTWNSLGWTPAKQSEWISNHLVPLMNASGFSEVKLLAIDDQRYMVPWWLNKMQEYNNQTMSYIDGIGIHFYWDRYIPASLLAKTLKEYPDKFLLGTEACTGADPWEYPKVDLGSWSRAERYIYNIMENLNHGYSGWIDWNLVLDQNGGPNWFRNFVDAPIIVIPDTDEFYKQPLFYAMGHFSKFIPRGSTMVEVKCSVDIPHVAFITPVTPVVVIFYNSKSYDLQLTISVGKDELDVTVSSNSINTVNIWPSTA